MGVNALPADGMDHFVWRDKLGLGAAALNPRERVETIEEFEEINRRHEWGHLEYGVHDIQKKDKVFKNNFKKWFPHHSGDIMDMHKATKSVILALAKISSELGWIPFVEFKNPEIEDCYNYCMFKKNERKKQPWLKYNEQIRSKGKNTEKKKIL